MDATDAAQLLALGAGRFDAAVCNMALMDMTTIDPLLRALPRLLKSKLPLQTDQRQLSAEAPKSPRPLSVC